MISRKKLTDHVDLELSVCDKLAQIFYFRRRKLLQLELEMNGMETGTNLKDVETLREK